MSSKPIHVLVYGRDKRGNKTKEMYDYDVCYTPLGEFLKTLKHPLILKEFPTGSDVLSPKELIRPFTRRVGNRKYEYIPGIIGSTSAKEGRLFYVEKSDARKIMEAFPQFFEYAEDTTRLARALIPHGETFGGGRVKKLRMMIVKEGTVVAGMPVCDGTIIMRPDLYPDTNSKPIQLRLTYNHYSIWQHLEYDEVKDDVKHRAEVLAEELENTDPKELVETRGTLCIDDSLKEQYLEAQPLLAKHPFFTQGASDRAKRFLFSQAFSVPIAQKSPIHFGMAVAYDHFTFPHAGKWIYFHHPIITTSSVKAIDYRKVYTLPTFIVDGGCWTVTFQYNTGDWGTIKGAGTRQTNLPDGIDMIVCEKDIKINRRVAPETVEVDAYITCLQRYDYESLLGVPVSEIEGMSIDYDSDGVGYHCCDDIVTIWKAIKRDQNKNINLKLERKSKTKWSQESAISILHNAMGANMGFATMLRNWYWSMNKAQREQFVGKLHSVVCDLKTKLRITKGKAERTQEFIHAVQTAAIQHEIESIKNGECRTDLVRIPFARMQSILTDITQKNPGYTHMKASDEAFHTRWPTFLDDWPIGKEQKYRDDPELRNTDEWRDAIPRGINGMPVNCFRVVGPVLYPLWLTIMKNPNPYTTRTFTEWAPVVSDVDMHHGNVMVQLYERHIEKYDAARKTGDWRPDQPEDVHIYRNQWAGKAKDYADKHMDGDYTRACNALWRASQSDGRSLVSGAPFVAFVPECLNLVRTMGASLEAHRCTVVGIQNIFEDGIPLLLEGKCHVVHTDSHKAQIIPEEPIEGLKTVHIGVCGKIEAKHAKLHHSWPRPGHVYAFKFELDKSGTAYNAVFDPVKQ